MVSEVVEIPFQELIINDFDIARFDFGQCLVDLIEGYDIDYLGVQSHMKEGFNAEIVNERLDMMALPGHRKGFQNKIHFNLSVKTPIKDY